VGDPAAAQVAEALAESTPGVKGVRNELEMNKEAENKPLVIPMPSMPPIVVRPPFMRHGPQAPSPGTPEYEALTELLKEGKKAMAKGAYEEAVGIYGAAVGIDPRNEEARTGMRNATAQLRQQLRRRWGAPDDVAPVPPVPQPPSAATPRPLATPDGQ
jgi:hypothetical protein